MSKNHPHKTIVVLGLPRHASAMDVVKKSRIVSAGLKASAQNYPKPPVDPAQMDADADTLEKEEAATAHVKGTGGRDAARRKVETNLHETVAYVQTVVDAAPEEQRAQLVASVGLAVKQAGAHHREDFALHDGDVSGAVHAVVKAAARRASYRWQWSTDGGKTYNDGPTTLQADAMLTGLPVGTTVLVRCQPTTKDGTQDWLGPVSHVVR